MMEWQRNDYSSLILPLSDIGMREKDRNVGGWDENEEWLLNESNDHLKKMILERNDKISEEWERFQN